MRAVLMELVSKDPFAHMVVNPRTFGNRDEVEESVEAASEKVLAKEAVWVEHDGDFMLALIHLVRYKLKVRGEYGLEYAYRGGVSADSPSSPAQPHPRSEIGPRLESRSRLENDSRSDSRPRSDKDNAMLERMRKLMG